MPGEALLLNISLIAVAVAGFSGVTATLTPPGGAWHPAMRIRQRAIISTSFNVMFESLAPVIAFALLLIINILQARSNSRWQRRTAAPATPHPLVQGAAP